MAGRRRGVTLVEMLVAVGITIMMLLATSVVFTSSGKASGKATAYSDIMQQARALCRQLEQDFTHLRPDMPLAILFEQKGYDTTGDGFLDTFYREDRVVFFANGDFQTLDGITSGNLARIFYGQARDLLPTPAQVDNPSAPFRRILTRRQKILSPLGWPPANAISWTNSNNNPAGWAGWQVSSPEEYDYIPLENSSESYWKTETPQNFLDYHFRTQEKTPGDGWIVSMVRRPDVAAIQAAISMGAVRQDALQKLYVLPDVSEFRIDAWYAGNIQWGVIPYTAAFYWNIQDLDDPPMPPRPTNIDLPFFTPPNYGWFSEADLKNLYQIPTTWPTALRFTFTIHDKDRRHFPEGKTFTYIVELPKRN